MIRFLFVYLILFSTLSAQVQVGADFLFTDDYGYLLKNKRVGLITNPTGVNGSMVPTVDLLKTHSGRFGYKVTALFGPEHGIHGAHHANQQVQDGKDADGIPIFSLHGKTQRPTPEMLKRVDTVIYDIQDIGSRSYTYVTSLFYVMEEAAKHGVEVIVLDRPNPINGLTVDGPLLESKWRSFVGYINVPYCHGMTVGELARFFNGEYNIGCNLKVIPMRGWKRNMSFADTGLPWIPTSPNIPEPTTPLFYPATGILGELQIVNIGIGYTLPFKIVGAPWINGQKFADALNSQKFPGVSFKPIYFQPFYGRFAKEECQGVMIVITDRLAYRPVCTQYLVLGMLKSLYPKQFRDALTKSQNRREMFNKVNGTDKIYNILAKEPFVVWKLKGVHEKERENFLLRRKKYLIPSY